MAIPKEEQVNDKADWFAAGAVFGLIVGFLCAAFFSINVIDRHNRVALAKQYHKTDEVFGRGGKYFVLDDGKMIQLPF